MPKIVIRNLANKEIIVKGSASALKSIHGAYVDWMHACGAKGRCTTCKMIVIAGADNLAPPTEFELKYMEMEKLLPGERLACQAIVENDIIINVAEENKLPHLIYTE